jgi:hypothetical protein
VHPNGMIYRWIDESISPAPAPDWLIALAARKRTNDTAGFGLRLAIRSEAASAYGRAALDREIADLAATAPGSRNNVLNVCAFRLAQLVAGGELDWSEVERALSQACETNGLVKDDGWRSVRMTIASGMRAGLQHPRSRSGAA